MRKISAICIAALTLNTAAFGQEPPKVTQSSTSTAVGFSSQDATILNMMGWGIGLAVGIGLVCGLIGSSSNTTQ